MNAPQRALSLVAILVALILCNGLQGSIDLYRHYAAPECKTEEDVCPHCGTPYEQFKRSESDPTARCPNEPHPHGPQTPGCAKWGENYGPSLDWLQAMRRFHKLHGEGWDLEAFSVVIIGGLMGGFRQLATTILWMKSDEYWHQGKADRMIPILRAVTWLDPNFLDGWRIAGWHWAYNLYAQAPEDNWAAKDLCLTNGLNFLKEGVVWNPLSSELAFELGWTYYDKAGDYRNAVRWFTEARKKPDYRRNYKIDTAQHLISHAYERMPDIPKALEGYAVMLHLTPEEAAILDEWVEFKKAYRRWKKLIKAYNAYHPKVMMPPEVMPGMPEGTKPPPIPPPPKPQIGTRMFPECQHVYYPKWTEEDIRRMMPDIERWKDWQEFDGVVGAYESAKQKGDASTMSLIKARIPHIERAVAIVPMVRKIETREPPAPGATITIKMRYLDAWNLFQRKKYEEARRVLMESMELEPDEATFPIGHHLLATIYEAMAEQNTAEKECPICRSEPQKVGHMKIEGSWKEHPEWKQHSLERHKAYFEGWVESAQRNQLNRLAHARVHAYQVQYNMPKVSVKKPRAETAPEMPGRGGADVHEHKAGD
jgi:tetratricopeptide (TPR) repeat protein